MPINPISIKGNDTLVKFDIDVDVAEDVDVQEDETYQVLKKSPSEEEETPLFIKDESSYSLKAKVYDSTSPPPEIVSPSNSPLKEQQINTDSEADDSDSRKGNGTDTGTGTGIRNGKAVPCSMSEHCIWTKELETAFEEALAIIPKFGRNKIKIEGRLCGRNELIAEYIFAKTGVYRSRKQVSSHIQVVKNLKSKSHMFNLIDKGPYFKSKSESAENMRRFKAMFSKLRLKKAMGTDFGGKLGSHSTTDVYRFKREKMREKVRKQVQEQAREQMHEEVPEQMREQVSEQVHESIITVKNISFTISGETEDESPIILTTKMNTPCEHVDIKLNTDISSRFPGIGVFNNTSIPILHNYVKMLSPLNLESKRHLVQNLNTNFTIEGTNCRENLAVFSTIYSFGNEILKVNEMFMLNSDQPFLIKFWKCFFFELTQYPVSLDAALSGITVKQIVYDNTDPIIDAIPHSKIVAVILWEFSAVEDIDQAISSCLRVFLRPPLDDESIPSRDYDNFTSSQPNKSCRSPTTIGGLNHQLSHYSTSTQSSQILFPSYAHVKDELYDPLSHQTSPLKRILFPETQTSFTSINHRILP